MSAWHGDAELKARIVERMKQHREADDFIQGLYQKLDPASALGYRGCAIGCLLDKQPVPTEEPYCDCERCQHATNEPDAGWHGEVEKQLGIPERLAELIDACFEDSLKPAHVQFAVDAIEAITVGADLSAVAAAYEEQTEDSNDEDPALLIQLLLEAPLAVTDA